MQRSEDRILATHAGSLPRSRRLVDPVANSASRCP
jgi:hypothetical protein